MNCLKSADSNLPHVSGQEKEWWTSELTHLKRQSMEIHDLWKAEGRPRNGPTYHERLRVRLLYRRTIKAAQTANMLQHAATIFFFVSLAQNWPYHILKHPITKIKLIWSIFEGKIQYAANLARMLQL